MERQRGGWRSGRQREGQITKPIFHLFSYEGSIALQVTAFRLNILHFPKVISLMRERKKSRHGELRGETKGHK